MNIRTLKITGIAAIALAAVVAGSAIIVAQGGPRHWGGFGRGWGHGMEFRQLGLTAEQRAQMQSIRERHQAELRELSEKRRAAFKAQQDAVEAVPADEATIRAKASELASVESDFAVLRSRIHTELFQVLTPEQQAKAKELRAEREKRRAERAERFKARRGERPQQQQPPQ
jgi:periplasmic protein CpxP/Spy